MEETPLEIMNNLRGEYNIVRAGKLAEIRIFDRVAKTLEGDPEFVENYDQAVNIILDRRNYLKKQVAEISADIELLQLEIEKEKYTPGDPRPMARRLFSVLGHL